MYKVYTEQQIFDNIELMSEMDDNIISANQYIDNPDNIGNSDIDAMHNYLEEQYDQMDYIACFYCEFNKRTKAYGIFEKDDVDVTCGITGNTSYSVGYCKSFKPNMEHIDYAKSTGCYEC